MDNPIAVVTINWNGADNTLRCLAALRASERVAWHLYVVDNASTDGSTDRLAREMSADGQRGDGDATLIRSSVNGGWTGGNNLGIKRALAAGHDLVFILNNDAFVRPGTLAILIDTLAIESRGGAATLPVLGPVHQGTGSASYDFRGSHRDPKTDIPVRTLPAHQGLETHQPTYPTSYISGAGMLIHRRHFDAIGLFDDRFYLNFDDTDWCARAERTGFPLLMVRDAIIDHVGSASIGGVTSPLQTYFMTRNRLLYAEKHGTARSRLRLLRRQIWRARELTSGSAWHMLLPQADPVAFAFRRGLIDYVTRRFGDCPDSIRAAQSRPRTLRLAAG